MRKYFGAFISFTLVLSMLLSCGACAAGSVIVHSKYFNMNGIDLRDAEAGIMTADTQQATLNMNMEIANNNIATVFGSTTVDGETKPFSIEGEFNKHNNIYAGTFFGYVTGTEEHISFFISYNPSTEEVYTTMTLGAVGDETDPVIFRFGSVSENMRSSIETLFQNDSNTNENITENEDSFVAPRSVSDEIASHQGYVLNAYGLKIDMFTPNILRNSNPEVAMGVSINEETYANYIRGLGYTPLDNGIKTKNLYAIIKTDGYDENNPTGVLFWNSGFYPATSTSTTVRFYIPTMNMTTHMWKPPTEWPHIDIVVSRRTVEYDESRPSDYISWDYRNINEPGNVLADNGLAFRGTLRRLSYYPNATRTKIEFDVTAGMYVPTEEDYTSVPVRNTSTGSQRYITLVD